jgi:hypothetical protein
MPPKKTPVNNTWRNEWRARAPAPEPKRPADVVLADAERAFNDTTISATDRKLAALKGTPTPVAADECFSMWIPAKELTATFKDTEIMTSLGGSTQPTKWSDSVISQRVRDFRCIRNAGIAFVCTNSDLCRDLGGLELSVCGQKFKIQPYSRFAHWYYVDLTRLPDEVSDGEIYDWFSSHGAPPVYIAPTHTVLGLQSRNRRVYFNTKKPPACLLVGTALKPLREIQFPSGFCVINHRIPAYNKEIPPFLQALYDTRKKKKPTPSFTSSLQASLAREPEEAKEADAVIAEPTNVSPDRTMDDGDDDSGDSAYDPEASMSDVASDDTIASPVSMEDIPDVSDTLTPAIPVPRDSVWTTPGAPPLFPSPSNRDDVNHAKRLLGHKASVFPGLGYKRQVDIAMFPPTQAHYPAVASHNLYEWIATGNANDPIAPDLDIYVQDTEASSTNQKPIFCGSQVATTRDDLAATRAIRHQWEVESMTLDEVCVFLQSYTHDFSEDEDMDSVLGRLQEQPCYHRPFFRTDTHYQLFQPKIASHALYRAICSKPFRGVTPDMPHTQRLRLIFRDNVADSSVQLLLQYLDSNQEVFWAQLCLAEVDLCLQVLAPSIRMDPVKVCCITGTSATRLPNTRWLLWDDTTLRALVNSPLVQKLLSSKLPGSLRHTLQKLTTGEHSH